MVDIYVDKKLMNGIINTMISLEAKDTWHFEKNCITIERITDDENFYYKIFISEDDIICNIYSGCSLSFYFDKLHHIMKLIDDSFDKIRIEYEELADFISFTFKGHNKNYVFTTDIIHIDNFIYSIPDYNHDCEINISTVELEKIIECFSKIEKNVIIKNNNQCISFLSEGDNWSFDIDISHCFNNRINCINQVTSSFFCEQLLMLIKPDISERVTLFFTNNFPLKISYDFGRHSKVTYFITPS